MKRRSLAAQRGGSPSPYAKYGKKPHVYPAWCTDHRLPIPREIQQSIEVARIRVVADQRQQSAPFRPRISR